MTRALFSYLLLLAGVYLYNYFNWRVLAVLIPLYMIVFPLLMEVRPRFSFRREEVCQSLVISVLLLLPFIFVSLVMGAKGSLPPLSTLMFHLVVVSVPEEVYFRGYLQEVIGNNLRGVFIVSLLFSTAHAGRFLFSGDYSALFTFFPSLVMGGLYLKTGNLLSPVVFHFLANVAFISFF